MELKNIILQKRKEKNMTQEQLAEQLNVARQTVSKWETGETTYWNENMKYVGKSTSNGNTKTYFDSKLNYEGKSEKQSNGNTNYYDKNLNYKGKSRDNSNKTTTHFKE